ncbi:MAG: hypothetical protein WCO73_03595 [Verrucomicrobiota bacterium]
MPPPKVKPTGRPHVVGLTALQLGTAYQLIETNTGEIRKYGTISPQDKEVQINIKGSFTLRSNAVEFLRVRIDGLSYAIPDEAIGTQAVQFPDPETVPPPPPSATPAAKKKR